MSLFKQACGLPLAMAFGIAASAAFADLPIALGASLAAMSVGLGWPAARHALLSVAAGAGLRLARPIERGERVRLYVPERADLVEGEVLRVGVAHTTLKTDDGTLVVANERLVLRSAQPAA